MEGLEFLNFDNFKERNLVTGLELLIMSRKHVFYCG